MNRLEYDENKYKQYLILCLGGLFIVSMIFLGKATFNLENDDAVYKSAIEVYGSWLNWVKYFYKNTGGRVLIHSILIILLNQPVIVWRLLSSVMIVATCYKISDIVHISSYRRHEEYLKLVIFLVIAVFFFLIPVLNETIVWASGSLNYLYPVCCFLWAFTPFIKKLYNYHISISDKIVAFVAVFICGNMEQSSAVFAVMGILVFLFMLMFRKDYSLENIRYLLLLWVIDILILCVSYSAPGNVSRSAGEMMKCSGYGMYSLFERLIIGEQTIYLNFFYIKSLIFWLLPSVVLFVVSIIRRRKELGILTFFYVICCAIQFVIMRKQFSTSFIYPFNGVYYIWVIFSWVLIVINGLIIISVIQDFKDRFLYLFLYLGGMVAIIVTSFAPTVFVSTHRTSYITYILFIVVISKLIYELISEIRERTACVIRDKNNMWINRYFTTAFLITGVVSSILFVGAYYISVKNGSVAESEDFTLSTEYNITDVKYNKKGFLEFDLGVDDFLYTYNNPCTGVMDGYDINVAVGEVNWKSGEIHVYKTNLIMKWATMFQYPNDLVRVETNYSGKEDSNLVLLITAHDGRKYLQYFKGE